MKTPVDLGSKEPRVVMTGSSPAPRPWLVALAGVVAGAALVILVGRLTDDGSPLSSLSSPPPEPVSARGDVRLERFESQAVLRTGDRWQITAEGLRGTDDGLFLDRPVLELFHNSRSEVRLVAEKGRVGREERWLSLREDVVLRVGDDFLVRAENLVLSPDGTVIGIGPVTVRTPHGRSSGDGIRVEPVEGKVTLSPGGGQEQVIRWTGWGRDLADLGEAYGNWCSGAVPEDAPRQTVDH
jgi:hypothetical protein